LSHGHLVNDIGELVCPQTIRSGNLWFLMSIYIFLL